MVDLRNLTLEETEAVVKGMGEPRFRARQIFEWINKHNALNFSEMTNIPKSFIAKMSGGYYVSALRKVKSLLGNDSTEKYLLSLEDSVIIESVLMRHDYGLTACVSTQAGCGMACAFCASAIGGKTRDLSAGEMAAQVYLMQPRETQSLIRQKSERITNVVMMGMGEPLDNYDASVKFIKIITAPEGYGISARNITLSTCGLIGGIEKLARENLKITLAVSLHAPNDDIRRGIMPVARKNRFGDLINICREYADITGRRVTFEYALIKGVNDANVHAEELAQVLKRGLFHVNIIPLNETERGELRGSDEATVRRFASVLTKNGVMASVRVSKGAEIAGACGQLRKALL